MYRRGPYYQKQRIPFVPRQFVLIIATAVLGLGGTLVMVKSGNEANWLTGKVTTLAEPQPLRQNDTAKKTDVRSGQLLNGTTLPGAATLLDLASPEKKEIAMRLVSSAENSSLDWRAQYAYIEDIGDGRGYTAGIIGFCSGTGDMLQLVELYTRNKPDNVLAPFLPALRQVDGTDSHAGLGGAFVSAWKQAAADPAFQQAQDNLRDDVYFKPALELAKSDGLGTLGQFIYYDAAVMHGPDSWGGGLPVIRAKVMAGAKPPAQGGEEKAYLLAFLKERKFEMSKESAHRDVSRIDDAQEAFLEAGNLELKLPLTWSMYGDNFNITRL
jgi:chitosanase